MGAVAAELLRFHAWANERLFAFCADLPDQVLDTTAPATYGTARSTLAHIVGAEASFTRGVTGDWEEPPLEPGAQPPTLDEMRRRIVRTGAALEAAARTLSPGQVARLRRRGQEIDFPAAALLAQAMYHAGEHRAQVVAILGQHGIQPPDLSGWAFGGDRSADHG